MARADVPWSVRNQARMHRRNRDPAYADTADALRYWLETPTAVAIRIDEDGSASLIAPFGVDDLMAMVCRPTPRGREKLSEYRQRIVDKNWRARWPVCASSVSSVAADRVGFLLTARNRL